MTTESNHRPIPLQAAAVAADCACNGDDYYEAIGPWYTAQAVLGICHVAADTLRAWRETNDVLGVQFSDGNYYYPACQFRAGRPAPRLREILAALVPGYVAPESRVGWFADRAYTTGDLTRWDLLHQGKIDLLVSWAKKDSARIIGP